jgi:hypothetical protein
MSDIFISYARADRPRAEALAKALEAQGWSVWWDWVIPTGKKFRRVIEEEINKARCIVVLWSATSIESDWVIEEASEGHERGILLPVLIQRVRPPMGFRGTQAADLTGWEGDFAAPPFGRLRGDIANLIGAARPGEFWMGATPGHSDGRPREEPCHRLRITKGYWLSETSVTVTAYKQVLKGRPEWKMPDAQSLNPDWSKEDHPMVSVTWYEVLHYCNWSGGRLPTEAE